MGVDFIRQRAKTFRKSWDLHRLALAERNLFTQEPEQVVRTIVARLIAPGDLEVGERVLVREMDGTLEVLTGTTVRAVAISPPASLSEALRDVGGYTDAKVATVLKSRVLEIAIC